MGYSQHMLAKAEHERMVRSVVTVSEYGEHLAKPKSNKRLLRLSHLWLMLTTFLHIVIK